MEKRNFFTFVSVFFVLIPFISWAGAAFASERGSFVIMGHTRGGKNFALNPAFVQGIEAAADFGVDALFLNGDLVYGNLADEESIEREWASVREALRAFEGSVYFIPGNHDLSSREMRAYYDSSIGDPFYAFDLFGLRFIVLDSTRFADDEESRVKQIEFLTREFTALPKEKQFFLFLHHPFWFGPFAEKSDPARGVANLSDYGNGFELWEKHIRPLLEGRNGFVVSGDAGNNRYVYAYAREGGIRYILNGLRISDTGGQIILYATVKDGKVNVIPISLVNAEGADGGLFLAPEEIEAGWWSFARRAARRFGSDTLFLALAASALVFAAIAAGGVTLCFRRGKQRV